MLRSACRALRKVLRSTSAFHGRQRGFVCRGGLMSGNLTNPSYWTKRAAEVRKNAEQMSGAESKSTMLHIAASYEKLALRAERSLPRDR
jgi:hypothetical protein